MNEFSAVDEIGCYFDRPGEPNAIHLEVHLPGRLDAARLREAIAATLAEHPRARKRRVPARRIDRRYRWEVPDEPDFDPLTVTRWDTPDGLARDRELFLATAPSPDASPAIRLRLAAGPDGDVLLLGANHCALDGGSCIRLIRSIAARYSGEPDVTPLAPRRTQPGPAPATGQQGYPQDVPRPSQAASQSRTAGWGPVPGAAPEITPGSALRRRLPMRPARVAVRTAAPGPGYGFRLIRLARPSREARALLDPRATVNDLLIAAFGLTVERWNVACGRPAGIVQVTLPMDARTARTAELGNLSRLAVVTMSADDRAAPARLVARVAEQTRVAKATSGSAIGLMAPVMAPGWLPIAVKQRMAGPLRYVLTPFTDTAKVSNWGHFREPLRFGDAGAAHGIWASGPAPMPRGVSVAIVTVGDLLHVTIRYRRALFDAAAADAFTSAFESAYKDVIAFGRLHEDPAMSPPAPDRP